MIMDLEVIGAQPASDAFSTKKKSMAKVVRVYQLHLGDERLALLADQGNQILAVCANRYSGRLERWLGRCDFGDGSSRCGALEVCLRVGHVVAGYKAAEWLSKEGRLLLELRPWVANVLLENAANPMEGGAS